MKNKYLWLLLAGLLTCMGNDSCKKDGQNIIPVLFTGGRWELATVTQTWFTGNNMDSTKTLNTGCPSSQYFTFTADGTCTYSNFHCLTQVTTGQWLLTTNQLFLQSNMVCKDTTKSGTSTPFSNAEIYNVGHYSLVLITGDVEPNYSLTKKRVQMQYGFIRELNN